MGFSARALPAATAQPETDVVEGTSMMRDDVAILDGRGDFAHRKAVHFVIGN